MLKHIFTCTALILAITACSKTEKPAEKPVQTTASAPQTQTIASVASVASTPTSAIASSPQIASVATAEIITPDTPAPQQNNPVTTTTQTPKNPVVSAEKAVSKANEKPAENIALKQDLTKLFKTIEEIDKKHQAKQAELEQKMQSAKTPEQQKKVFDEIMSQLDLQKQTLTKLKFDDKRVSQVRDKMLKNIAETRSGMAIMAKNPEATPQTHPEIGKTMQQAEKTASEVRDSIEKLVKEADLDPTHAQ